MRSFFASDNPLQILDYIPTRKTGHGSKYARALLRRQQMSLDPLRNSDLLLNAALSKRLHDRALYFNALREVESHLNPEKQYEEISRIGTLCCKTHYGLMEDSDRVSAVRKARETHQRKKRIEQTAQFVALNTYRRMLLRAAQLACHEAGCRYSYVKVDRASS